MTRQLMKTAPKGSGKPIFRNTQGNPWKRMTGVVRFITLKEKLKWDTDPVKGKYSCYSCRHTFAHRMLSGYWTDGVGCSIETLAELIGDTPKVAFDHYGREWGQHYQEPLWNAIGEGKSRKRSPTAKQLAKDKAAASPGKSKRETADKGSTRSRTKPSADKRTSRSKQKA
ncbi:MAG: hypothetical protein H6821_16330 [Planctomycetaceae bacterium]|nr:hypothetical protein [Planctomycetaceae bacterium]